MRKALILVILALVAGFGLYRMGFVRFNYPDVGRYPVLGVDVSHHQGPIRWSELRSSGISFAFIKATEGADHQDAAFALNWQQAGAAGVARGRISSSRSAQMAARRPTTSLQRFRR